MSVSDKKELTLEEAIELRKKMGITSADIKIKRIEPLLGPIIEEIKHKLAYDTENNIFSTIIIIPINNI